MLSAYTSQELRAVDRSQLEALRATLDKALQQSSFPFKSCARRQNSLPINLWIHVIRMLGARCVFELQFTSSALRAIADRRLETLFDADREPGAIAIFFEPAKGNRPARKHIVAHPCDANSDPLLIGRANTRRQVSSFLAIADLKNVRVSRSLARLRRNSERSFVLEKLADTTVEINGDVLAQGDHSELRSGAAVKIGKAGPGREGHILYPDVRCHFVLPCCKRRGVYKWALSQFPEYDSTIFRRNHRDSVHTTPQLS